MNDASSALFVTGETTTSGHVIRVYDTNTASFDKLYPICSYEEHSELITSLIHYPNNEYLFFSGSRDSTVRLWDRRQPRAVGMNR